MSNADIDARMLDCPKEQNFSANWNAPGRMRWFFRSLPTLNVLWVCDFQSNHRSSSLSPFFFGVQYSSYKINKLRWATEALIHKHFRKMLCLHWETQGRTVCNMEKKGLLNTPDTVFSSILYVVQRLTWKTLCYCKSSILFLQNPKWE